MTQSLSTQSTDPISDAALLSGAAHSDGAALNALVRRYVDFVFGVALRQMRDRHAAEDVAQTVFVILSRKAASVRAPALPAWLHRTTLYTAANARRAEVRRSRHERSAARPEALMQDDAPEPDPLLPALDDAIASLRQSDRQIVIDRFLLGHDLAAVARSLGTSTKTAQKRLERALDRLRLRMTVPVSRQHEIVSALAAAAPVAAPPGISTAVSAFISSPVQTGTAPALAHQVLRAMAWEKIQFGILILGFTVSLGAAALEALRLAHPFSFVANITQALPLKVEATLRDGVSIRLVGTSANPSANQWYDPDGKPLATAPYAMAGMTAGTRPSEVAREFAFATNGRTGLFSVDPDGRAAATLRYDDQRSVPRGVGSQLLRAIDTDGQSVPGIISVVIAASLDHPVTASFDVAAGPWVSRVVSRPDADTLIVAENDIDHVMLSRPYNDGGASINYWPADFYSRPDTRLVAIDTGGGIHALEERSWDYRSPQDRAAEPLLDQMLPAANFSATPFGDIVDRIGKEIGAKVVVDWDGMARQGIDRKTPVTTSTGRESLYHWLPYLFQYVRGTGGEPQYTVRNGVLTIGPSDWHKPQLIGFCAPDLPLDDLARFEVQTRPFDQWIIFAGLSMQLGQPSHVMIRTSDDPPPGPAAPTSGSITRLADGSVVELVALGDAMTGKCWRPDGTPTTPPFDYRDDQTYQQPPKAGTRRLWAMTVIHQPDGQSAFGRSDAAGERTRVIWPRMLTSMTGQTPSHVRYQVREFEIDAKRPTLDWKVDVAAGPPAKASIERGPTGWNPAAVARVEIRAGGDAFLWSPIEVKPPGAIRSHTEARVWTPRSVGNDDEISIDYVLVNGDGPGGSSFSDDARDGYHETSCQDPLDLLQRITLRITHYDETAIFRNVSLRENVRTDVVTTTGQPPK